MPEFVELSEVVSVVNEKAGLQKDPEWPYVGLEHIPSRGTHLLGNAPANTSVSTNTVFRKGDVLFGKLRPYLRKTLIAPFEGYCSTDILVLRARDGVDPAFAGVLFQSESIGAAAERTAIGTKMPRTSWAHLRTEQVFLPALTEQRLVSRILGTLDTQIQRTEALIAKLEKIRQGLLTDLLTRGIDENGHLRPTPDQAPHLYKDSIIGRIPKQWEADSITAYLNSLSGIKPGPFGSSLKKSSYVSSGFKIYGQEQVIHGDQFAGDYYIGQQKYDELADFAVAEGDVLISLVGTIGKVLVIRKGYVRGLINPRLMRLRPNQSVTDPAFLALLLSSPTFTRPLTALAGGGTMPVINKRIIQGVKVPVIPSSEQERITEVFRSLDSRISKETDLHAKLAVERRGIMEDLLTGRVRVTPLLKQTDRAAS